ncbi:hypothetical protein NUACC21_21910 [Scytonema sp. NUACC21]
MELSGTSSIDKTSGLFAQTLSTADAGSIIINTRQLIVKDGAQVTAGTNEDSQGNGGILTIQALDKVELSGTAPNGQGVSGLFARTRGSGRAGDLTVTTRKLIVRDGAQVTVSSLKLGAAGNLTVRANSISLDNGAIVAQTNSGNGGNITLENLDLLLMRSNSLISAAALNQANGGNIRINALDGFIVAVPQENSDLLANAFQGNGGNINITASGIYGLENRTQQFLDNNISEINASSQLGVNGSVETNNTDINPSQGLVELPVNLVDASQQIATGCNSIGKQRRGSFMAVGRGGLPESPTELLTGDAVLADWVTLSEVAKEQTPLPNPLPPRKGNVESHFATSATQIVEASGWVIDANGDIALVAQAPTANKSEFNPYLTHDSYGCSNTHLIK